MTFHRAAMSLVQDQWRRGECLRLFRKYADENSEAGNGRKLLRGQPGSPLRQRLANAEFDESSFCAVAVFPCDRNRPRCGLKFVLATPSP